MVRPGEQSRGLRLRWRRLLQDHVQRQLEGIVQKDENAVQGPVQLRRKWLVRQHVEHSRVQLGRWRLLSRHVRRQVERLVPQDENEVQEARVATPSPSAPYCSSDLGSKELQTPNEGQRVVRSSKQPRGQRLRLRWRRLLPLYLPERLVGELLLALQKPHSIQLQRPERLELGAWLEP